MAIIQKTVLITGCSAGGIGDALAQCFQKHGFHVFATARNLSKIEHLGALGMTVLALDVEDQKSIEQAVEAVTAATGGTLDVLINSSGGGEKLLAIASRYRN
jgi:1-acylglycerone phosphate reductase